MIAIGGYCLSHDVRSEYDWMMKTSGSGYSIRRKNWKTLMRDFKITLLLKEKFKLSYIYTIRPIMIKAKSIAIKKIKERADF
jgi:hypothetical protein